MLSRNFKINLKIWINKKGLENREIMKPIYKWIIHIINGFCAVVPGRKKKCRRTGKDTDKMKYIDRSKEDK